jgi:hypothetical protein
LLPPPSDFTLKMETARLSETLVFYHRVLLPPHSDFTLKVDAARISETLVSYHNTIWRHDPKTSTLFFTAFKTTYLTQLLMFLKQFVTCNRECKIRYKSIPNMSATVLRLYNAEE